MSANRENPLVSIVIPVHNGENCILKCINSILKTPYRNLEILIIENGSKDRTRQVIDALKDSRIKKIYLEQSGVSRARNEGIRKASGEYLMFVDADDEILPETIPMLVKQMENSEADILRFSGLERIGAMERRMDKNLKDVGVKSYPREQIAELFIGKNAIHGAVWMLFMRNQKICPFREELSYLEDTLFCIENFQNKKIAFYNESLYLYNRNETSATGNPEKASEILLKLYRGIEEIRSSLPKSCEKMVQRWAVFLYISRLSYFAQCLNPKAFVKISRENRDRMKMAGLWGKEIKDFQMYHRLYYSCVNHSFFIGAYMLARMKQKLADLYLKIKKYKNRNK